MSLRTFATVVAAASGLVLLPTVGAGAAPSGGCPYPPNRPVLTLTSTPGTVKATQPVSSFGRFTQNNCGIHNGQIKIQRRWVVNGKPTGSWSTVTTKTTNSNGVYSWASAPRKSEQLRAVFSATSGLPTTISPVRTVNVRTYVPVNIAAKSKCRIQVVGGTIPRKGNRYVYVQARGAQNSFHGWKNVWRVKTNSRGLFDSFHTLPCGKTYNLAVYISHDSTDLANRSRTIYGLKTHK